MLRKIFKAIATYFTGGAVRGSLKFEMQFLKRKKIVPPTHLKIFATIKFNQRTK
jgi:hypothetical protein